MSSRTSGSATSSRRNGGATCGSTRASRPSWPTRRRTRCSTEWNVCEEYVDQITSAGISLDSLRSSHRVEVTVRDPNDVDQIFDAISYNKGGSVLRMLERAVVIRRSGRAFGGSREPRVRRAATDDLWRALGEASAPDVRSMMDGWTRKTGLPVVRPSAALHGLKLPQERFFLDRDPAKPGKDKTLWDIPVALIEPKGKKALTRLRKRVIEISAPEGVKLNAAQSGFYLSHYDREGWKALGARLVSYSTLDRYGLQSDAYSLMRAGYLPNRRIPDTHRRLPQGAELPRVEWLGIWLERAGGSVRR